MAELMEVFDMVTKQTEPDVDAWKQQERRQRRAARTRKIGAFGAVAAIGLVGMALFAGSLGSDEGDRTIPAEKTTVSADEAAAVDLAKRFLTAFGDFDAEKAMTYVADDADITGVTEGSNDLEGLSLMASFLEAQGYQHTITSCEATTSSTGTTVVCAYDFHAIRSDEIGRGPFSGGDFTITVRDGEIVRVERYWEIGEFSPQMWEPFADWVSSTHPKDFDVMYVASGTNFRLTEESIRLWEKRSREYVDVVLAQPVAVAERFMEARNAHDANEALSLIADDGAKVRLLAGNRPAGENMPTFRMDRDELALAFEAERIYGVTFESVVCGPAPDPAGGGEGQIACSFTMDNRLRQIAGMEPLDTYFHVGVHDGRVTFLSFPWLNVSFPSNVPAEGWRFVEWLQTEHPEVGSPMKDGTLFWTGGQELNLKLTPEAIDLLEQYLDEYEAAEGAS